MSRAQALLLHVSLAVLTITGAVFAWMKYFAQSDDPFAAANHPLQPVMLHLHVISAPLLVFAFGWIFESHVLTKLRAGAPARRSGLSTMWLFAAMVASGYLLQVLTSEAGLKGSAVTHWVTSGAFVIVYVIHQIVKPPPRANGSGQSE